jgi:type I restriction enzyme R subunit
MEHSIKNRIGTVPTKSIIFAISHRHALEIYKNFNRLYPHLQRRGFATVIDSHIEHADKTLDGFKTKDFPPKPQNHKFNGLRHQQACG